MQEPDPAAEEAEKAAAEAANIGGSPTSEPDPTEGRDEAQRPLEEAGQGEAEGFEQAEQDLIEHATHGDQHAARRVIEDAPLDGGDDARAAQQGDPDYERSSEREEDTP
jgi:hypothetical protein